MDRKGNMVTINTHAMNSYLFRGKRVDTGEWCYGYLALENIINVDMSDASVGYSAFEDYVVLSETIGQWTGLVDKRGVQIYTGDILKDDSSSVLEVRFGELPLNKPGDCVCTYHAYYCKDYGSLGIAPLYECREIAEWMHVIGNIHDNPIQP